MLPRRKGKLQIDGGLVLRSLMRIIRDLGLTILGAEGDGPKMLSIVLVANKGVLRG